MAMHDVFISYSSKDAAIVETACRALENNGIKCWIAPRNIPAGSNYAREIPAAIRGCTVFLLVISKDTQASIWVSRELDFAINEKKIVIPMMLEDIPLNDEFNFYLAGYQRYYAFERSSGVLQTLVQRIKALLGVTQSVPAQLRCDGYYFTQPTDDKQCMYFRFYPDGKVVSASSSGDPVAVSKWLNEFYGSHASYQLVSSDLKFDMPLWGSHQIKYRGTVQENALDLVGFSTFAQKQFAYPCTFMSLAEIEEEAQKPKAQIIDIRTIDPQKPARLQETKLRFDGFYCTVPERGFRHYYRFYPDGAMVSALTAANPAQAAKWLNMEKYEGGRAIFDGQTLRMEAPLSDGYRYFADLLLRENGLTMKGFNTYTQKDLDRECTFLPFSEIKE